MRILVVENSERSGMRPASYARARYRGRSLQGGTDIASLSAQALLGRQRRI
jgi:hypothetical protein